MRLIGGLWVFGAGIALMVRANLGVSSWDVLHDALRLNSSLTFGMAVVVVSVLVLLASSAIGVRPGPGTVANVVLVGVFTDVILMTGVLAGIPNANVVGRLGVLLAGVGAIAVATALYISAGLGAGPRDSLMLGVAKRLRLSTGTSRALIEGSVLIAGGLLGGRVGVGTAVFAVAIGPAMNLSFRLFGMEPPRAKGGGTVITRAALAGQRWIQRGQLCSGSSRERSRYTGGRI